MEKRFGKALLWLKIRKNIKHKHLMGFSILSPNLGEILEARNKTTTFYE